MKTILPVVTALIISACCCCLHGQAKPATPMADPNAVTEALTKVRELKSTPYHLFLRDAAQIFRPACVGQEWSDVKSILEKEKCPVVESWGNDNRRNHLLREKAFSFENGRSLDAYIWLTGDDGIPRSLQGRSRRVLEAHIVLGAKVNAPYDELIAQQRFPRDSVLDLVLRSEDVKREGARWPLVKTVFVDYERILSRSGNLIGSSSGFDVYVEFTASSDDDIGGQRMNFFVRSGLDPVEFYTGDVKPSEDFTSKDTLGDVKSNGGNEWSRGESAAIEANKKKYLKSHKTP